MAQSVPAEAAAIKDVQRADWDEAGRRLGDYVADLETGGAVATERLIELAGLHAGQTVLDVGTGYGEPALTAAPLVEPGGRVVGIDLSPQMIALARQRAGGRRNIAFTVGDFESVDQPSGSIDVVLSRFALMYATDRARAFGELRRVLAPGGVLAAAVWGPPHLNRFAAGLLALAQAIEAPPPPDGAPGAFALADRDALTRCLTDAGFSDIRLEELVIPFRFAGVDRYTALHSVVPPYGLRSLAIQRLGSDTAVDQLVAHAVEPFTAPDGSVSLPSTAICVRAVAL